MAYHIGFCSSTLVDRRSEAAGDNQRFELELLIEPSATD
jgi:hypothetical protein